jgi:crotonobetainyl-CoA:carnitine CoA-transferase CaiB-like acyl-CoA transferase
LGEDTEAILRELGYDDEALASLRADGAIPEE